MKSESFLIGLEFSVLLLCLGGLYLWSLAKWRWSSRIRTVSLIVVIAVAGPGAIFSLLGRMESHNIVKPPEVLVGAYTYFGALLLFLAVALGVVLRTNRRQ
jgi:hypothetical protein